MELRAIPTADAGGELIFRRYSEYRFDAGVPVVGARIFGGVEEAQRGITTFELMPGRYLIYLGSDLTQIGHNKKWNYAFGTVELKAGHRYRTERVNCTFGALQDPLCADRSGWRILTVVDSGTGQTEMSGGR